MITRFTTFGQGRRWKSSPLWLVLILILGCGQENDGPARYALEGEVLYDGKPVPAGEIHFDPDSSKGNQGPSASGVIQDGKYSLSAEKGMVGGPMKVRIIGFDGKHVKREDSPTDPRGTQLFTHEEQVELPKEAAKHNFTIPKK